MLAQKPLRFLQTGRYCPLLQLHSLPRYLGENLDHKFHAKSSTVNFVALKLYNPLLGLMGKQNNQEDEEVYFLVPELPRLYEDIKWDHSGF